MEKSEEISNQNTDTSETAQTQVGESQQASEQMLVESTLSKKSNKRWLMIVLAGLVVILIALGYFTYHYYQPKTGLSGLTTPTVLPTLSVTPLPEPTTSSTIVPENSTYDVTLDINTWKSFTSPLGFTFKYPSEWGEVNEEIRDAKIEGTGDSGKTYNLTFTKIVHASSLDNLVFGSGESVDYSAGRGGTDTDYSGNSKEPKGVSSTVWARPTNCIIPISSHLYFGRIDFNLPGKEISGVRLLMPVVSQSQIKILDTEYDSLMPDEQQNYCTGENVEKEANTYIKELESKQLDDLSKKQLSVFKQILSSAKVL